ncbi:MAG: type II toxin-antitoxin system PemK/MazF family toxin [Desulfovibrionaceae bacterium]|nr:type II toxin-antitoxin system PemK/MazF family toxin [Desulfovibrionaceae bacterium]
MTSDAPDRGDFVHVDFDPQAGHEQAGVRFALVLSPRAFNVKTGLAFVAPITSRQKGYPFEVPIPPGERVAGVVLADQARSLDWRTRRLKVKGKASDGVVEGVTGLLAAILGIETGP